jgi:hypothetical protein
MLTAQLEGASETRPASEASAMPESESAAPKSPTRRLGITGRPKRTPNKPSPRPLPPPPAHEEELLDPFKGRVLRRSPPRGVLPAQQAPAEPELPPTPTEKGISSPAEANKQPTGIHSTPTKRRPRRSRALAEKIRVGSSPLKLKPVPSQTLEGKERRAGEEGRRESPHPARGKISPFADKTSLRDSLLAEVAQLERDINQLQRPQEDQDCLIPILARHVLPTEKDKRDPKHDWLEAAALNPMTFLPFGNPNETLPNPFAPPSEPAEEESGPPISHHPVPMTAGEELPFLALFTPLVFSSSVTLLPRDRNDDDAGPVLQKRAITVSSTPPGLFSAKIDMVVDTKRLSIADLSVSRLDPSSAAELGPFVTRILDPEASSSLRRNVSVMTWAMAEWTRLATKRARLWCRIRQELGTSEGIQTCAKKTRKGRWRKGARRPSLHDDDEGEDPSEQLETEKNSFSKADLLAELARTSFDLDLDGPSIRIQWRIDFDWTGEGRSKIGLLVATPGKCESALLIVEQNVSLTDVTIGHNHDDRKSLADLPDLFDKMVKGGGPMGAVRTVVALLVEDNE